MLFQGKKSAHKAVQRKLYSFAGILHGRQFDGEIPLGKVAAKFVYSPKSVTITNEKVEITGSFTVTTAAGTAHTIDGVKAVVASVQAGTGNYFLPPRLQAASERITGEDSNQALEQAGSANKLPETAPGSSSPLPATEYTGKSGFVGVMYLQLQPLNAAKLGLPFDLSAVQFNARFAPIDDVAREIQALFSVLIAATYRRKPNYTAAAELMGELNQILNAHS